MKSHEMPVLIAQDIMEVEATHPQVGVVNTRTMIMTNLQKNTVPRMSTTNATPPQHHHGTTVTMAAALADTALLATPQKIPGLPVLPGHTPKIHLVALMAGAPHLHKEGVLQTPVPPKEAPGTQEISLVTQPLVITTAELGEGVREHKEIAQAQGGRIPLKQVLNHSSNSSSSSRPLRVKLGSNV